MDEHNPLPGKEEEAEPRPYWETVPPPSTAQLQYDAYQPPRADKSSRVAVIAIGIACGIVVILVTLGVIAAIMIPTILLSARKGAVNEKARNSARMIISAEAAYFSANQRYGELADLSQGHFLDDRFAQVPADLGNGVTATLTLNPDASGFKVEVAGQGIVYVGDESGEITER